MKVIWKFFRPKVQEIIKFKYILSLKIQLNYYIYINLKEKLVGQPLHTRHSYKQGGDYRKHIARHIIFMQGKGPFGVDGPITLCYTSRQNWHHYLMKCANHTTKMMAQERQCPKAFKVQNGFLVCLIQGKQCLVLKVIKCIAFFSIQVPHMQKNLQNFWKTSKIIDGLKRLWPPKYKWVILLHNL